MFLFDSVFNLGFRMGCFEEFHCHISLTLTTILEKEGEFSQFGTSAASEGRLAMQLKDHHNQQHLLPTPSYQDHLLPPQVLQDYEPFDGGFFPFFVFYSSGASSLKQRKKYHVSGIA